MASGQDVTKTATDPSLIPTRENQEAFSSWPSIAMVLECIIFSTLRNPFWDQPHIIQLPLARSLHSNKAVSLRCRQSSRGTIPQTNSILRPSINHGLCYSTILTIEWISAIPEKPQTPERPSMHPRIERPLVQYFERHTALLRRRLLRLKIVRTCRLCCCEGVPA